MRLRINITAKLLGYLLLASMVPLVVLGFSALEVARRVVLEQAQAENAHLVGSFASYLTLYDEQIEDLATNIASNDAIGAALRSADKPTSSFDALNLRAQVGYTLNAFIRVKGLVSLDLFSIEGGRFHVGETLTTAPLTTQTVQELMRDAQAAQQTTLWRGVDDNINSSSRYRKVRSVVRSIRHFSPATGESNAVGMLVISLTDEIMQEYLRRAPLRAGQKLMLVDQNGRVALHSSPEMVGQMLSPELLELVRNGRGTQSFKLDGQDVLMDVAQLDVNHSSAVMLTPPELVTSKVNRLTITTLTVLSLCLLAVGMLTWRYERTVVAPIRSISAGFHFIEKNPDAEPNPLPMSDTDDEIARLVEGYNRHLITLKDQKQASIDLYQARQSAEAASQAKSDFLANMSHEIRTPMNAILGLLHLLQSTELTARQRDYTSKTEGAAKSLLGLLNDILDFSKVEAGKMTLESEPFRVDSMLHNLAVVLSSNTGGRDIEVLFDIDPTLPEVVKGDAMRLQQILINLGGNAVKFTSKGQVVLSLRKLSQTANSVTIEFAIKDSGIGIAPEHQAQIFSGFSQAESSTTRRFGGTGLGLAISKRFVELMGGGIHVDSTVGVGSTFSFVLELPTVTEVPAELQVQERAHLAPQSVLIVDDNPIAGELMLRTVHSWGWNAELAASGAQALSRIEQLHGQNPEVFPFSVVYQDWQMPEMDGWETTRRIRELARTYHVAQPFIIMVTAHSRETLAHRSAAEQDSLNGFLVKPVTASMMFDALVGAQAGTSGMRQLTQGRSSKRQLSGMRILVVEDNLINQQVAEELLIREGAIVSLASNGRLGVDAVAAAAPQFDAVLMDIQMPVLDGYDATQLIREELGLKQLPIIAMTANALDSDRAACLAAGMNEHIGKPFDMAKLVSLLIRTTGIQLGDDISSDTTAEMSSPPQFVPNEPDLDIATALARMSGMRSLYVRTAKEFAKALQGITEELGQYLRDGDLKASRMLLHTLKGNSGTLGATELAAFTTSMEALCKAGAVEQCIDDLVHLEALTKVTHDKLIHAISELEGTEAPASIRSGTSIDHETVNDALVQLAALADASDMELLHRFSTLRELLEPLPDGFVERLDQALHQLDFEAAGKICHEMKAQIG